MNENTNTMPPEEQAENDRDARAEELESTFSYDGYQVVRKELFAHLRDPAIVIRKDSITFNTACITGLEDVVYVHVMFNSDLKRIVVRGCDENDKDALRWCIAKPDKRKSRKMTCKPFSELVYKEMGWDTECRYKMLGYRISFEGEAPQSPCVAKDCPLRKVPRPRQLNATVGRCEGCVAKSAKGSQPGKDPGCLQGSKVEGDRVGRRLYRQVYSTSE